MSSPRAGLGRDPAEIDEIFWQVQPPGSVVVGKKMAQDRVVIVGGGVIGLSAAWNLLQAGFPVQVVEREGPEGATCSTVNAGMVVPSHFVPLAAPGMIAKGMRWIMNPESPFYVRPTLDPALLRWGWLFWRHANARHVAASRDLLRDLNLESRRLFAEFGRDDDFGLVQRGLLMLCRTREGLDEEVEMAHMAESLGIGTRVLDPQQTAAADPGVTMDVAGAVHFLQDCHLDPARFMAAMRRRVLAAGGEIASGVEIEMIERNGGQVTAVSGGGQRFAAKYFVIAGGSWSAKLLRPLGLRLPLQAGKGYSITLPKPPEMPQLCSIFAEAKVAITPLGDSLRVAGTMEVGGLDLSINRRRVNGILKSVPLYFPKFRQEDFAGIEPWAGLRPVSPDGLPYVGQVPGIGNLFAATGHAMLGLSLGPVTGRLVAELVAGRPPFTDISRLAVGRFG